MSTAMDRIEAVTAGLAPSDRAAVMRAVAARARRADRARTYATPGELAAACLGDAYVRTPAMDAIDQALVWAVSTPSSRLIISLGPQEGKSTKVVVWLPIWLLQQYPDWRIIAVSHSLELIRDQSRVARNHVLTHGSGVVDPVSGQSMPDLIGYTTAADRAAAHDWRVDGHAGGVYVAGVGGTLTGKAADIALVDDLYPGLDAAGSAAYRRMVWSWWTGTLLARLSATAPVIMIGTRWHEKDLIGELIAEDVRRRGRGQERLWQVVNIPAIAAPGVPDSLARPTSGHGRYLISTRGRTPAQWETRRGEVGTRAWEALYQGDPRPAGESVFAQSWWDRSRLHALPGEHLSLVAIDPAETGEGDEAGVIALAGMPSGVVAVTHDRSGHMRSGAWARAAVLLALETRARWMVYEAYVREMTYSDVLTTAWTRVREQIIACSIRSDDEAAPDLDRAAAALLAGTGPSSQLAPDTLRRELIEVVGLSVDPAVAVAVTASARPPYQVAGVKGPARAGKRARAVPAVTAAETGRLVMLGEHVELEAQSTSWMESDTDSPDRMDALVHGYVALSARLAVRPSGVAPAAAGASLTRTHPRLPGVMADRRTRARR